VKRNRARPNRKNSSSLRRFFMWIILGIS